jgi:hypothetical protein
VTSSSDAPLQLLISPVDGLTGQTSGSVYANRDAPLRRAGAWITPSISALSLAPHARALVPFRVTVPPSATPGDHLGGLAVENANPQHSGGQFSITQVFRTVVGVDVLVPGPASPGIRIGRLGLRALPGTAVATVSIGLENPGGKLVKPHLAVSLQGPSYHRRVTRQLDTILPGDHIEYPFIWPDSLVAGTYHVEIRASGGATTVTRAATLTLGTALHGATNPNVPGSGGTPVSVWIAALAVLVVGALAVWRWVRRRRARPRPRRAPKLSPLDAALAAARARGREHSAGAADRRTPRRGGVPARGQSEPAGRPRSGATHHS